MQISLHHPLDGFYCGTRFDRSGIFRSLVYKGQEFCGPWFQHYDPFMHDSVQGPVEEFSPIELEGLWLKTGVGLLEQDGQPYDRFKLYRIVSPGHWEADGMRFMHSLDGFYDYVKEIVVTGENSFELRHSLHTFVPMRGDVYNHNFFTLGKMAVTESRIIGFPFTPEGDWRTEYDCVGFTPGGIRFSRALREGESVYCGNVHKSGEEGMPYELSLGEGPLSVHIKGDVPVLKAVIWANHRIACVEPYILLDLSPGETFYWNIKYSLH